MESSRDYFDPQNGWLQVAFANETDRYVLPSLVAVNYKNYLYHSLKRAGYKAVFFWEELNPEIKLRFLDANSEKHLQSVYPKSGWFGTSALSCRELPDGRKEATVPERNIMEKLIERFLESETRTALVIPMSVFNAFFQTDRLEKLKKKYNGQPVKKGILLVTAGARAGDSNTFLKDEKGALYCLLHEVRSAAKPDVEKNLYSKLKANLGLRCAFLNDLDREDIRNLVLRYVLLDNEEQIFADEEQYIDLMTDFLRHYYRSSAFRDALPFRLRNNPCSTLNVINDVLKDRKEHKAIGDWLREKKPKDAEYFRIWLEEKYPVDESCPIYETHSQFLTQWKQLHVSLATVPSAEMEKMRCREQIYDIERWTSSVVMRGNELDGLDFYQRCIDALMDSFQGGQLHEEPFAWRVKAMWHWLRSYYDEPEARDQVLRYCGDILDNAAFIQTGRKTLVQCKENVEKYRLMIEEYMEKGKNGDPSQSDYNKARALSAKKTMEQWKLLKENCEKLLETRKNFVTVIDEALTKNDLMRMKNSGRYLAYVTDINSLLTQRESIAANLSAG